MRDALFVLKFNKKMVTFRNNIRRNNFRRGERNYKSDQIDLSLALIFRMVIIKENLQAEITIMPQN